MFGKVIKCQFTGDSNILSFPALKTKNILFYISVFLFLQQSLLLAKTYYVDINHPAADNHNPGTEQLPWATIRKANQTVGAGDTVIVRPGVYHDWIHPEAAGDADNWIVYKSEPLHGAILEGWVVLDSVAVDGSEWRHVSPDTANIWLRDLKSAAFTEAWMDSVRLDYPYPYPCDTLQFSPGRSYVDSTRTLYVWLPPGETPFNHTWHITLRSGVWLFHKEGLSRQKYVCVEGFVIQNYGLSGINVSCDYVRISKNISRRNGRGGIEVIYCDHVLVEDNEVYENCTGIGYSQGITAFNVFGTDILFRRNISHHNYDGADPQHCGTEGHGFLLDTCHPNAGASFINNVAYNNAGFGFGVYQACNGFFINNTSFNNHHKSDPGCECYVGATGAYASNHLLFRNNIFAGRPDEQSCLSITYPWANPPVDVKFDHNLYYQPDADENSKLFQLNFRYAGGEKNWSLNMSEFQNFSVNYEELTFEPHWGEGSLVADPQFIDWQAADFRLAENSPAIDAGSSESAPATDFYGILRPQGAGYDLGACEFIFSTCVRDREQNPLIAMQVYPNPFNSSIHIRYQLVKPVKVKLTVYDILGRAREEIISDLQPIGIHELIWKGRDSSGVPLASGVYFLRLQTGTFAKTVKILLVK